MLTPVLLLLLRKLSGGEQLVDKHATSTVTTPHMQRGRHLARRGGLKWAGRRSQRAAHAASGACRPPRTAAGTREHANGRRRPTNSHRVCVVRRAARPPSPHDAQGLDDELHTDETMGRWFTAAVGAARDRGLLADARLPEARSRSADRVQGNAARRERRGGPGRRPRRPNSSRAASGGPCSTTRRSTTSRSRRWRPIRISRPPRRGSRKRAGCCRTRVQRSSRRSTGASGRRVRKSRPLRSN